MCDARYMLRSWRRIGYVLVSRSECALGASESKIKCASLAIDRASRTRMQMELALRLPRSAPSFALFLAPKELRPSGALIGFPPPPSPQAQLLLLHYCSLVPVIFHLTSYMCITTMETHESERELFSVRKLALAGACRRFQ